MLQCDKIGVTGTRRGLTLPQAKTLQLILQGLNGKELHMGDCIGVDVQAAALARSIGMRIVSHPPLNSKYRAYFDADETRPVADYLIRNEHIVNETEILLGMPKSQYEELRSGTWACTRYARKVNRRMYLIYPDGSVVS